MGANDPGRICGGSRESREVCRLKQITDLDHRRADARDKDGSP